MLKHGLDLRPVRNTSIIEIRYFAESAEEAASIANEIARVYQQVGESAAAAAGASLIKISIVDLATPGLRPVRPNKPANLAIGALAGSLLGTVGGAGLAGYKSRKVR
jgi:capsular polysaccharide biosynthesis protein